MTGADAMPRDERLLLTGVAVDAFGTGLTVPFLVVYLHGVRGLPLETVGLIVAVPAVVALLVLVPIGTLIDRIGARRVQMGALVCATGGAILLSYAETAPMAFAARVLAGLAMAAFWPANGTLIARLVPSERRQRYFGVSFALVNAGIGVGGIVGGAFVDIAQPWTFATVYRVDAVTFLVPLAILGLALRHVGGPSTGDAAAESGGGSYGVVLGDRVFRRVLVLTFVGTFVGYAQIEGGWTAYASTIARVSPRAIGIAFAVNTAIIVVLQLVVLRVIDGRRRTRMLMLQGALWAVSWSVLGLAGRAPATPLAATLVAAAFGLFAVGETLQAPISPALVNDVSPDELRGRYGATSAMAFHVAGIVGPSVSGFLLGSGHGFGFIAVLVVGCGLFGIAAAALERVLPPHANGLVTSALPPMRTAGTA